MRAAEQRYYEKYTKRLLAPVVVAAIGVMALTGCDRDPGSTPEPTRSSIYTPGEPEEPTMESTLPEDTEDSTPEVAPSNSWPSEVVIEDILKRGCKLATEESRKQYPNLWNNGLTEISDEFEEAYGGKAYPNLFDMELADACPVYARMTDHGAG